MISKIRHQFLSH